MDQKTTLKLVVCGVIIAILMMCIMLLPRKVRTTTASADHETIRLTGAIRDFRSSHPDFDVSGDGHYVGLVDPHLSQGAQPTYSSGATSNGDEFRVVSQWTDSSDRPIAPSSFGAGIDGVIPFEIVDGKVIPGEDFAAMVTVIGSAIQMGANGYHLATTMKTRIGNASAQPFGPFGNPVRGNLNDNQSTTGNRNLGNPRSHIFPTLYPAGSVITATGRSWLLRNQYADGTRRRNWSPHITADTAVSTIQVRVLRNGDPVPGLAGVYGQSNVADYVSEYVDTATNTMKLAINEVIYLYELGMDGSSADAAADFQDLVLVLTLAPTTEQLTEVIEGPALCGEPLVDNAGVGDNTGDTGGGITSSETFGQWYRDHLGVNDSVGHSITLTKNDAGVYEYLTDAFHPADDRGFGNEGNQHNRFFTYAFNATFTHQACQDKFFEFEGSGDTWVFVNEELVLDLGGVNPGTRQFAAIDRLGLEDGESYQLRFFHAQRSASGATFRLRTNLELSTGSVELSGGYD